MKKSLVGTLLIGLSQSANAVFVDNSTYLTDTSSGLDWLDVTATIRMSYEDVSVQFGKGGLFDGYRYATGDEFNDLIAHWISDSAGISTYGDVIHAEGQRQTTTGNTAVMPR